MDMYTLLYLKWITKKDLLYSTGNSASYYVAAWMRGEFGGECCDVLSHFSHVRLFATPWTVAHQAPLSMGFSRQEYWSGLPLSRPGHLPNPGIQPMSLKSPALAGGFFTTIAKS